jgi:hypothetical protein
VALRLNASQEIRAPAALVFGLISTPERLPEWNTSVAAARRAAPADPIGQGTRAIMSGRLLGQVLESETEVVEFEPARTFATRAIRGPKLHTLFRLDSIASGTRLIIEVSGEVPGGRLGGILAEGFLRSELRASLQRLKDLAEREARAKAEAELQEGGDPACWLHLEESRGD